LQRHDKILLIYFCLFFLIWISVIIYLNYSIGNPVFPEKIEKEIEFTRVVNVDKIALFETMADIQNYPEIFPNNVISVNIINQSENVIFAKETVVEAGIKSELLVKHMFFPPDKHIATVVDGDAKNSTITAIFDEQDSSTKLTIKMEIDLKGVLIPFGFLPQNQFQSAMNTVISGFVDYTNKMSTN